MPSSKIRVAVADGSRLFREGLRLILAKGSGIEVVADVENASEAVEVTMEMKPDVLLIDLGLVQLNGVTVIRKVRHESPGTCSLVLSDCANESEVFWVLREGAKGYLSKNSTVDILLKAIQVVGSGEVWLERKLMARYLDEEFLPAGRDGSPEGDQELSLTSREQEILQLISRGFTNKEISRSLCISEKTVKCHLSAVFRKLRITRRTQAILYTVQNSMPGELLPQASAVS